MKIEFRVRYTGPAGTMGSFGPLVDEAPTSSLLETISAYRATPRKQPQIVPRFRATAPFIQDRGNRSWEVSFTVDRQHQSPAAAALFLAEHPLIFGDGSNIDLKITIGGTVLFLGNAALSNFEPQPHSDQSSLTNYTFVGQTYTTTEPE